MLKRLQRIVTMRTFFLWVRRSLIHYFFAFICLCLSSTVAMANKKPLLLIQHWQTSQGTPVYFVAATELPMIDVRVIFNAGSAYDGDAWGLSELVANTLAEGSQQHNADQIATTFDQVGAKFNSDANRDVAILSLRTLSDPQYLPTALQMFTEVLNSPTFPEPALERVRQQTLASIRQQQQEPGKVASDAFYKSLYNSHPYSHPVIGTPESVNLITQAQAQAFYHRFYVAHNAKIILVGNLSRNAAEKIAEQLMLSIPLGKVAPPLATAKDFSTIVKDLTFPSQQTTIIVGQLGIDRQNPQYFPLMVGNYLLGQMPLGSLLFEQVRNQQGLTYGVSSSLPLLSYRGPFAVRLQTRASEKKPALESVKEVLQKFISGNFSPTQLDLAKQNLIKNFPLNLATNDDIATALTQIAINHWPLDYLDTYQQKVNDVTTAQVKQAFAALLVPNKMLTITVGP